MKSELTYGGDVEFCGKHLNDPQRWMFLSEMEVTLRGRADSDEQGLVQLQGLMGLAHHIVWLFRQKGSSS